MYGIKNVDMNNYIQIILIVILLVIQTGTACSKDIKGGKDHPSVGRLTGSEMLVYKNTNSIHTIFRLVGQIELMRVLSYSRS